MFVLVSTFIFILYICIYQPLRTGRIWHKVNFFKRSLTGLNSKFSFSYCLTKTKEPSLPYYLPISGGKLIGFIPFPVVLVLFEMQSISSWIWTRVDDGNYYSMGISLFNTHRHYVYIYVYIYIYIYIYIIYIKREIELQ